MRKDANMETLKMAATTTMETYARREDESVIDMSNYAINQRGKMVRATEPTTIQSAILKDEGLNNNVVRNGLLKRSSKRKKDSGETSKQEDARSNNKRARTGKRFDYRAIAKRVTLVNSVNSVNNLWVCYECGSPDHFCNTCPRLNKASRQVQSNPNKVLAIGGNNFNRGNNGNQARGRAFTLGANEALQDPNIMTGTFSLNNQYDTVLFDSGADYHFVSTKFMPLINTQPSDLNFSYVIEMANGKNEKTNKIIRECTVVLEDVPFSSDFIDKFVRDPNKTPDSSQRPPHNCPNCGNPVDGLYCRQYALLRMKMKEDAGENSSQSPPHIDHHCCYGCGDSLDSIFFQR
nr:hypothetical protein [Tanacetum cinerariifolium]